MNERYQVFEKIAEGGRAVVFRGWDSELGREIAIKRLRHDRGASVEELLKEARILLGLRHPNILKVYEAGMDTEGPFLIMEFIRGETLDDLIERTALTLEDFAELVTQTLDGVHTAHAAGLIHLDLKPGNLMLHWQTQERFQVKILDFGLAQAVQPTGQASDEQGGVLGSIFFMAPEQFERGIVDFRTDLYALGAVFYYSLTQRYPFDGETSPQVMVSHLYHKVTPLAELRPDLPPAMIQWTEWLMQRLPSARPASVAEALKSFQAILANPAPEGEAG